MSLTPADRAYNAVVISLNEIEAELKALLIARNKLWASAQAIHPLGRHGANQRGEHFCD